MCPAPIRRASVLIVDDEEVVRESFRDTFKGNHCLYIASNARQALRFLRQQTIDLVYVDILLPDMNGIDLLREIKQITPTSRVIVLTAMQAIETAVDAMKNGAFDVVAKPLDVHRVQVVTAQALSSKNEGLTPSDVKLMKTTVARNAAVDTIIKAIEPILPYDGHVLIEGPGGCGKQQMARALHNHSKRAARPYAVINCAALSANDIAQKLWGFDGRALNDTRSKASGKVDLGQTGCLFFNNISYLALDLQDRLTQLIEHQEFKHPSSPQPVKTDLRVIAATTQNLKVLAKAGLFRKDLYYRLSALPLSLPLLHASGEAIGLLLALFRRHHACRNNKAPHRFAYATRTTTIPGDWPNSVREFEHLVARLCRFRPHPRQLPADLPAMRPQTPTDAFNELRLKNATQAFERQHILGVLAAVKGNRSQAARCLGIHRNTLLSKTKELGIDFQKQHAPGRQTP